MTGVAPEPADRAVARVIAGGLEDSEARIADQLAALLNEAARLAVTVLPHEGDWFKDPTYTVEGDGHATHTVSWDTTARTWTVTATHPE